MENGAQKARRYRFRAEELRTVAQDWIDAAAMLMLGRLAMQYERMADQIERYAEPDGFGKPDGHG